MADERLQLNVDFSRHPELYNDLKAFVDDPSNEVDVSKLVRDGIRRELARRKRARAYRIIADNDMKVTR